MLRSVISGLSAVMLIALAGCSPDYSPNTYNANAVQQANKVEPAVVVGFREVAISADGTIGAVTGGAAGGVLGAQAGPTNLHSALGAVGGSAAGGLIGAAIAKASGETTGWEYIVRKPNGELLSLTQREPTPLPIGQKVLVITGSQARIIPDFSVAIDPPDKDKAAAKETPPAAVVPPVQPAAAAPPPAKEVGPPVQAAPVQLSAPPAAAEVPAPAVAREEPVTPPSAEPAPDPAPAETAPAAETASPPEAPTPPPEEAPAPPSPQTGAAAGDVAPAFWEVFNRDIMADGTGASPQ